MIRADISVTPRAYLSRNRFQSKIQARQWVAFEEMVSDSCAMSQVVDRVFGGSQRLVLRARLVCFLKWDCNHQPSLTGLGISSPLEVTLEALRLEMNHACELINGIIHTS